MLTLIGRMIGDKIRGHNEITEFFFPRDMNHFCMGCYKCIEDETACPYYEEKKKIMDAVEEADILIVTTPTYCLHASAPLKSFLDVNFDCWMPHRPKKSMFSKRAVIVSTSAGASTRGAIKDVKDSLFYMGIPCIIKYGIAVQAMNWEGVKPEIKNRIDKATTRIAGKLSSGKKPHVGFKTRFIFNMMGMMQKKGWSASPVEKIYWEQNGWLSGEKPWRE